MVREIDAFRMYYEFDGTTIAKSYARWTLGIDTIRICLTLIFANVLTICASVGTRIFCVLFATCFEINVAFDVCATNCRHIEEVFGKM